MQAYRLPKMTGSDKICSTQNVLVRLRLSAYWSHRLRSFVVRIASYRIKYKDWMQSLVIRLALPSQPPPMCAPGKRCPINLDIVKPAFPAIPRVLSLWLPSYPMVCSEHGMSLPSVIHCVQNPDNEQASAPAIRLGLEILYSAPCGDGHPGPLVEYASPKCYFLGASSIY